jgi:hypothetical protein
VPTVYTRVSSYVEWISNETVPFAPTDWAYLPATVSIEPIRELSNGDFEQGPGSGWLETSTRNLELVVNDEAPTGGAPHSGDWLAVLGGADNEFANLSQTAIVPAEAPILSYFHWIESIDVCGYDTYSVYVDGLLRASYALCSETATNGWAYHTIDLTNLIGQQVLIEFIIATDGSILSYWFVDDVAFVGAAKAAPLQRR